MIFMNSRRTIFGYARAFVTTLITFVTSTAIVIDMFESIKIVKHTMTFKTPNIIRIVMVTALAVILFILSMNSEIH